MSNLVGLLGIALAFFIVIFFTYKGFHLAYTVIVAVMVVFITNGMPILETFSDIMLKSGIDENGNAFVSGVATQAKTLLPLYLFGAIFGKLFIDSGAATSLSGWLLNVLGKNADANRRRLIGSFCIIFMNAIFNYVGVDPFASLFTMIGIATGVMAEVNIPRRFMPVHLVLGTTIGTALPGSLAVPNILCINFLAEYNTTSYAAAIPGFIFVVFVFGASMWYINKMVKKAAENKEDFEYGPLQPANLTGENLPPVILTIIPLVIIPVGFSTIFSDAPWAAMAVGCIAGIICFGRYIPKKDGVSRIMTIADSMNNGVTIAGIPAIILLNYTLGYAIEAAPAFGTIVELFTNLPGPALLSLAFMGILLLGAAASASGLIIALGVAATVFIPILGVDPNAAHRVLLVSNTVLDSLPFSGAIVALMSIIDVKYKDGYPQIAITTVLFTFLGVILVAALLILFPGLA